MSRRKPPLPPILKRPTRPVEEPRLRVTIFCEGKNTEPDYFKKFADEHGNKLVVVKTIGPAGAPPVIVAKALIAKRDASRQRQASYEKRDQVWAAFDYDDRPNIQACIKAAKDGGVRVAFSNPCFEFWALLHFVGYGAALNSAEAQHLLRKHMPKYDPSGTKLLDYHALKDRYEDACRRAETLRRQREVEGVHYGCPYTDVHVLTDLIVKNGKRKP
ncbi:RloB family protein [Belnapia sp. F-4-1]|uniref:RloB family protein n=1 Tax=Belnapia sp. F-4-1 TaxID=1545443 RepID=UPI0009DEE327|nr:RloB family protein [Belnapia sp. F-4-1]